MFLANFKENRRWCYGTKRTLKTKAFTVLKTEYLLQYNIYVLSVVFIILKTPK